MEGKDFFCYEFGEFRLDVRRRSLSKNGEKVSLPARNFDLLLFMVENGGRLIEHEELLDKVWAGTYVEQATLKKGVSALRQILAEKPENEFIKTIPRRGYSFVSPVRVVSENNEALIVRETEQEIIVEEYEESDEPVNTSAAPEKIIAISPTVPVAAPKKNKFSRAAMIGMAVLSAVILAFFILLPYFRKTPPAPFPVADVRVNRVSNSGKIGGAIVSPDGNYLLFASFDKDGASLWLKQMATSSMTRLTPSIRGGFWGLAFAPDNNYVYYIFNNEAEPEKSGLYKLPFLGGEPRRIKENVGSISGSPDGKKLALARSSDKMQIFTVNTDGEDERPVATLAAGSSLLGISWTPDSAAVLCTIRKVVENRPVYYVSEFSAENGQETIVLPPQEKIILGAVWMPDKSAILLTMRERNAEIRQIWQYLPVSKEWQRVTNDNNSYTYITLTRDGKNIITTQESRLAAIWVTDDPAIEKRTSEKKSLLNNFDGFRQITQGVNNFDWLSWLADNRLLYSATDDTKEAIFTINADGSNVHQVTKGEDGIWISPNATGDGEHISFLSTQSGSKQAWRIDADGKNPTRVSQTDSPVSSVRILRDNSTVIYTARQNGGNYLFKQTGDGQITQLTESETGSAVVSADEKLMALEMIDKHTGRIHTEIRSLKDSSILKSFEFESKRQFRFTPDGKNIAYDTVKGESNQIMIQPLDGGEPFVLTEFQNEDIFSFDWSPDGKHFAIIRGKQLTDAVLIKTVNH